MPVLNDLLDNKVLAGDYKVNVDLGVDVQHSESGITFTTIKEFIPRLTLDISVDALNEDESKAIVTYLINNRGRTMDLDLTYFRIDYDATDISSSALIASALTGITHTMLTDQKFGYGPMPNAVNLHRVSFQLEISKNVVA